VVVLGLNAAIALVTRWRGAHAEGVVLAGDGVMAGWIQLKGVDLNYGAVQALRGVDLRIRRASGSR
jgi:hypothetical protein